MALLGYRDRGSFWSMVHSQGVPCVRINARVIRFPEAALADWIRLRQNAA